MISEYIEFTKESGYFETKRKEQEKYRMMEMINDALKNEFTKNKEVSKLLSAIEKELMSQKITSYAAAQKLLDAYFKSLGKK